MALFDCGALVFLDFFAGARTLGVFVSLARFPEAAVWFEVVAGAESEPEGGPSAAGVIGSAGAREEEF